MPKPLVFISSVIDGMENTRELVSGMLEQDLVYDFVLSESEGSKSRTPLAQCRKWARECDIHIVILGERYGWVIPRMGISVTELEFNEARKENPEKILAYVSAGSNEVKQEGFVKRVEDFAEGYFRRKPFKSDSELIDGIRNDLAVFMKERLDLVRAKKLKVRPALTPSAADYVIAAGRERAIWMMRDAIEVAKSLGFNPVELLKKKTLYVFTGERDVGERKDVLFSIWVVAGNLTYSYLRAYTEAFQEDIWRSEKYNEYRNRFTMFMVHGKVNERPLEQQAQIFGNLTCFKVESGIFFGVGLDGEAYQRIPSFYENMLFVPQVKNKEAMQSKLVDGLEWLDREAHRINLACNYIEPLKPIDRRYRRIVTSEK